MVWEVAAHDTRVLASALSPDGGTVGTAASDENLKVSVCFVLQWLVEGGLRIWEGRRSCEDEDEDATGRRNLKRTDESLPFYILLFYLQFWKIWDARPVSKGKVGGGGAGDEGEMAGGNRQGKSGATGGLKIR